MQLPPHYHVLALRVAIFGAAMFGIASHAAMVLQTYGDEFVLNDILIYGGWYGLPFSILGLGQFATRSRSCLVAILVCTIGLAWLDRYLYSNSNSREWTVLLGPLVLGPIAAACLLVAIRIVPGRDQE